VAPVTECLVGEEAWKAKEAKTPAAKEPAWGPEGPRGVAWEVTTALTMLDLSSIKIGAVGASSLATALRNLKALTTRDIGRNVGTTLAARELLAQIHGTTAPQRLEPGVHFIRDRAGMRTRLEVLRPDTGIGELLGHVLRDRQRVPDRQAAIDEHRDPPRGADGGGSVE
jgi:hypothetical protein